MQQTSSAEGANRRRYHSTPVHKRNLGAKLNFRPSDVHVPKDSYGLEVFASGIAGQMKTATLMYLIELLGKHLERRHTVLTPEQQWLEDRGILPRYGWPKRPGQGA
jgi:hypothetical protein